MKGIELNTLENIELAVPKLQEMLEKDKSIAVGPQAVAPLAEAIVTLARELKIIRERVE